MERATGIEPVLPAWEADTLPLSYARSMSDEKIICSGNESQRRAICGECGLRHEVDRTIWALFNYRTSPGSTDGTYFTTAATSYSRWTQDRQGCGRSLNC